MQKFHSTHLGLFECPQKAKEIAESVDGLFGDPKVVAQKICKEFPNDDVKIYGNVIFLSRQRSKSITDSWGIIRFKDCDDEPVTTVNENALWNAAKEIERLFNLDKERTVRMQELASEARRTGKSKTHKLKNLAPTVIDYGDAVMELIEALNSKPKTSSEGLRKKKKVRGDKIEAMINVKNNLILRSESLQAESRKCAEDAARIEVKLAEILPCGENLANITSAIGLFLDAGLPEEARKISSFWGLTDRGDQR
jgi:hypothetical protein